MNEKFSNDLLSAFFDGELSPAERAEVERRLAASNTTKQELGHLEQLSAWLGQLPRQSAPQEFRAQVMQRIEREMLLPSTDELQSAKRTTPKTPPKRRSHTRRWQALSTLVVCVAVIVATVLLVDSPDDRPEAGKGMKVADNRSPDAAQSDDSVHNEGGHRVALRVMRENVGGTENKSLVPGSDNESGNSSVPVFADSARPPASRLRKGSSSDSVEKAPSREVSDIKVSSKLDENPVARNQKGNSGKRSSISPESRPLQLVYPDSLKNALPGQIVEALESSSGQVKIVRLTVVDRQAGLKYLQVLLQLHEIPVQSTSVAKTKQGNENADISVASEPANQLLCVFVEATDQQLMAAFQQMKDDAAVMVLDVDETLIAMESLDHYLPQTVKLPLAPNSSSTPAAPSDHKPASPRGSSDTDEKATESTAKQEERFRSKSKKITSAAPAPVMKNRNPLEAKKAPFSGSGPIVKSRQLTISLPADFLPSELKLKTKPSAGKKHGVKGRRSVRKRYLARRRSGPRDEEISRQKHIADVAKKSGSSKPAKPAKPFLILFVLTLDESQADGKAKTPASSASPSSPKTHKARSGKDG